MAHLFGRTSRLTLVSPGGRRVVRRNFSDSRRRLLGLETNLEASNGQRWRQPLGLFINNEFHPSARSRSLTTIDP